LVYLTLEDQKLQIPVLFDEIQKNGMSGQVIHVSFKKVSLNLVRALKSSLSFESTKFPCNRPTDN